MFFCFAEFFLVILFLFFWKNLNGLIKFLFFFLKFLTHSLYVSILKTFIVYHRLHNMTNFMQKGIFIATNVTYPVIVSFLFASFAKRVAVLNSIPTVIAKFDRKVKRLSTETRNVPSHFMNMLWMPIFTTRANVEPMTLLTVIQTHLAFQFTKRTQYSFLLHFFFFLFNNLNLRSLFLPIF